MWGEARLKRLKGYKGYEKLKLLLMRLGAEVGALDKVK